MAFSGPTPTGPCPCAGGPKLNAALQVGVQTMEQRGDAALPDLLAMLLLM